MCAGLAQPQLVPEQGEASMAGNPLAQGQFIRYLRMCTEQEPVVVFSVFIGAIGTPRPPCSRRPARAPIFSGRAGVRCGGAARFDAGDPTPRAPAPNLPRPVPDSSLAPRGDARRLLDALCRL